MKQSAAVATGTDTTLLQLDLDEHQDKSDDILALVLLMAEEATELREIVMAQAAELYSLKLSVKSLRTR
jgi:hypothetical protein